MEEGELFWWVGWFMCVCVGGSGVGATGGRREGFGCAFDATFFKGLSSYTQPNCALVVHSNKK